MAFLGAGDAFGRYEVIRRIGRGGMGSVFEARQVDLGRPVALKVLNPEFAEDPEFRARFEREARTLALLDSPHVIQVFDAGQWGGDLFIATQLVLGRDLLQLLRQDGPLTPEAALQIVGQIASALADAHDAGLLHRDLKPSNILVRETRADPFAYLCDFGIARHAEMSHTRTQGGLGTLAYMAPECHEGADASVASDIYSLGCVLWAALTGRAPYERTSEFQVALAHVQEEIPTYTGDPAVSGEINAILQRCMAKDPADRFASAGQLNAALVAAEQVARGLSHGARDVTGVRVSTLDPQQTQVRVAQAGYGVGAGVSRQARPRHRFRAMAVAAAALLVILGLGGTAVALLGEEADARSAGKPAPEPTPSTESGRSATPTPRPKPAPSPQPGRSRQPTTVRTPAPADSSSPMATEVSTPTTEGLVDEPTVACWDGTWAARPRACPIPAGREGLQSVFPSLEDSCVFRGPTIIAGKAEVYECEYGTYMIRYSRWQRGADRYGYLNQSNAPARGYLWSAGDVFAGRQWLSFENSADESKPYQWSAAYRNWPYTISVEGIDEAARAEGMERVEATASDRIALR